MSTFISYSRANSDFAVRLAKDLKSAGLDVWLDQLDIPTGARWDDEIERALEKSSIFLIILSPESIESQNVKDEVGYAIDSGKHILPVVTRSCKIPLRLRRFQFVDFSNKPYEDSLAEIKYLLSNTKNLAATGTTREASAGLEIPPARQEPNVQGKNIPRTKQPPMQKSESKKPSRIGYLALIFLGICALAVAAIAILSPAVRNLILPLSQPPSIIITTMAPDENQIPPVVVTTITPTEPPTTTPTIEPPSISSSITWTIDTAGACRDDKGDYPRWTEYGWNLSQCKEACQNNPNCQGFAMSKQKNYCQLLGSDGVNAASQPGVQITRGDQAQPDYDCYLKSNDKSILTWSMDSTGVCRDDAGGYPRWSEYNWTLSQCEEACQNNPNCQGFAISKQKSYCQLFGSDGNNEGSNPNAQISRGDSSASQYSCYIKR